MSATFCVDLIRHAESELNAAATDPGWVPIIGGRQNELELSELGEVQADILGQYANQEEIRPTRLFHSPAERSRRTCELSSRVMGLTVVAGVDDRLQELDQGEWTNQSRTVYQQPEIKRRMAELGGDFSAPGGESMNDVAARVNDFLGWLVASRSLEVAEHIWVHTHGVAIKSWVGREFGWPHDRTYQTRIDNTSLTRVALENDQWRLIFLNQRPLLTPARTS